MTQKKPKLSAEQIKVAGKQCTICNQYLTQEDAQRGDYVLVNTKRSSEICTHKHCWIKLYGGKANG
jgi:hypothetical protein